MPKALPDSGSIVNSNEHDLTHPQSVQRTVVPRKATVMPHPHEFAVSRRRLMEGGAAVLGALALSGPAAAHRAAAADTVDATPSGTATSTSSASAPNPRTPR